jgi:hypothetical protein
MEILLRIVESTLIGLASILGYLLFGIFLYFIISIFASIYKGVIKNVNIKKLILILTSVIIMLYLILIDILSYGFILPLLVFFWMSIHGILDKWGIFTNIILYKKLLYICIPIYYLGFIFYGLLQQSIFEFNDYISVIIVMIVFSLMSIPSLLLRYAIYLKAKKDKSLIYFSGYFKSIRYVLPIVIKFNFYVITYCVLIGILIFSMIVILEYFADFISTEINLDWLKSIINI